MHGTRERCSQLVFCSALLLIVGPIQVKWSNVEDDSISFIDPSYLRLRSKEVKPGDPRLKVGATVLAFQQVFKDMNYAPYSPVSILVPSS